MVHPGCVVDRAHDEEPTMLIGELARASGLTVRTLHHYDRLGLLTPPVRDESGYRRYGQAEVERLYRIRALKALGLSLEEIVSVLSGPGAPGELRDLVAHHLAQLRERRTVLESLENRLALLLDALGSAPGPDADQLLSTIGDMAMLEQTLQHDYSRQADRYDRSRGVSGDVLRGVTDAIQSAPGRQLLDVGGGTGNYAAALRELGWAPTVIDASPQMRRRAEAKGLPVIAGEATMLPFADGSYDAVTMISMLHQVSDWRRALGEARRVLRSGGRLAVMGMSAEHLREVAWAYDLFPSMREFALPHRPTIDEMLAELPGGSATPIWFNDLSDASLAALCAHPEIMLEADRRRQTSFFERLERDHPEELEAGLVTLRGWLEAGRRPERERAAARERLGDATVIAWSAP
jgi:DNA-binding transcriptional MerR regulator